MATQVQFRRGTTSQNNAFTGAQGEFTVDTEQWTIRIHDGTTPGGRQVPTLTATQTFTNKTMSTGSIWNGNAVGLAYGGTGASLTGVAGAIVYSTGSAMALSLAGTSGQVLTSGGTSGPTWVNASSLSTGTATTATTATNIAGGSAGYLVYQQDTNTTGFIAPGTSGYILKSTGASTPPSWVTSDLTIGTTAVSVGTTQASFDGLNILAATGTSHWKIPVGTTAQRPGTPAAGMIRYNSTQSTFEGYSSGAWSSLGGVKSVDALTYIIAETSAGASNGDLDFFAEDAAGTAATQVGQWNRTNLKDYTGTLVGTQTTQNVFNTTATTVNAFGAATSLTLGATTGTATIRNTTVAVTNNATVGGTLGVTGNTTLTGDLAVNGGDITTTATGTATVFNTNATTLNIGGAATTVSIGAATGTATINNANVVITGNLTVNGTTTTINSTTIAVDDITLELGTVATPTDTTANGGGIVLKGATDKSITWSTTGWTSSEDFNLVTGKAYEINGTSVLNATTLGSGVTASSLTSVGTIGTGTWQGTIIAGQYGGTGVNNSGKTITLGGNLTTSGAFATTLTVTAATNVTLPTTGTLATLAGTETLTNKTLTSPTLTTPSLGVASATSINKVAITAPATGSTLTIADGKTLTVSNTLTFTGTDASSVAFGAGGTVAYTANKLSAFAATTSAELLGVISDETGSGSLVFATSPSLTTPTIGGGGANFSGSTSGSLNLKAAAVAGTGVIVTIPATTGTLVTTGDTGTVTSTMIADGTIVNADINASAAIAVSKLAASTISGITLGNNLATLTIGTGLSGTSYNGSTAVTIANTGVTSITGTTNQVTASASTGGVTLSLPQSINTGASVQFGSFGVGTAASGTTGEIRATNAITSFYSDERLKKEITVIENAVDKVMQLRGVTFKANELAESFGYTSDKEQVGVIAQDVQKVLPQVVVPAPFDRIRIDENTEISRSGENYMTVHYEKIVPLLIEAIKEQQAQIEELKAKLGN